MQRQVVTPFSRLRQAVQVDFPILCHECLVVSGVALQQVNGKLSQFRCRRGIWGALQWLSIAANRQFPSLATLCKHNPAARSFACSATRS